MRLRNNKFYSGEVDNNMDGLENVENLGECGQGNSIGSVEEIGSFEGC